MSGAARRYILHMEDHANDVDIALLKDDPSALILRHQVTIRIIVKRFIESGMFQPSEFDDVVQHVNAKLLEKLPRIRAQYNGLSLFRTYISSIIRHECLDLHASRESDIHTERLLADPPNPESANPDNRLLIEHDVKVFRAIIRQFHDEMPKLLVCLKLVYRIPIEPKDILAWWPGCPEPDRSAFLNAISEGGKSLPARERFALLRPIANGADNSHSSADSVRHWTDDRIHVILRLLNGSPPTSSHTPETLGILLEDFFTPFLLHRQYIPGETDNNDTA